MGNLYADAMAWEASFDIMMFGSGAIRKEELGPIIEYQDMLENTPFDDQLWMLKVTGAQFRRMVKHIFRDEAWEGHTEFYQFSKGCRIVIPQEHPHDRGVLFQWGRRSQDDQS